MKRCWYCDKKKYTTKNVCMDCREWEKEETRKQTLKDVLEIVKKKHKEIKKLRENPSLKYNQRLMGIFEVLGYLEKEIKKLG